ncbi:MAG: hypothetical protein IKD78_08365 [Bacteroidales bacterium]|nr:hypothetical protein [Bacteroidales bacterium]
MKTKIRLFLETFWLGLGIDAPTERRGKTVSNIDFLIVHNGIFKRGNPTA